MERRDGQNPLFITGIMAVWQPYSSPTSERVAAGRVSSRVTLQREAHPSLFQLSAFIISAFPKSPVAVASHRGNHQYTTKPKPTRVKEIGCRSRAAAAQEQAAGRQQAEGRGGGLKSRNMSWYYLLCVYHHGTTQTIEDLARGLDRFVS